MVPPRLSPSWSRPFARLGAVLRLSPRLLWALGWTAAGLALGAVLRYAVIEPRSIGQTCGGIGIPWWCLPRTGLIKAHEWYVYGGSAIAAAGLAWWRGRAGWAQAALALGAVGLVVYNTEVAALGMLLALIRLLRP
jgi:hypothetical protein